MFTAGTASRWLDCDHVALRTAGIPDKQPLSVHALSKQCSEHLLPLCGEYLLGVPSTHIVNFSANHPGSKMILVQQNLFPY